MMEDLDLQRVTRSPSLATEVAEKLQKMIASEKIDIGEKIPSEHQLCSMFGVSRTVIREAIPKLTSLGLIETKRGVGSIVVRHQPISNSQTFSIAPNDAKSILHFLELRMSVESMAAEYAALRSDEKDLKSLKNCLQDFERASSKGSLAQNEDFAFHFAIATATKNPFFQQFYQEFNKDVIPRMKNLKTDLDEKNTQTYLDRIHAEHQAIYQAIEEKNPKNASKAMRQHLQRAYDYYQKYSAI